MRGVTIGRGAGFGLRPSFVIIAHSAFTPEVWNPCIDRTQLRCLKQVDQYGEINARLFVTSFFCSRLREDRPQSGTDHRRAKMRWMD